MCFNKSFCKTNFFPNISKAIKITSFILTYKLDMTLQNEERKNDTTSCNKQLKKKKKKKTFLETIH